MNKFMFKSKLLGCVDAPVGLGIFAWGQGGRSTSLVGEVNIQQVNLTAITNNKTEDKNAKYEVY